MPVLSAKDIRRLINGNPPLIEGWVNLDEQVQPNGFEITLRDISAYQNAGQIALTNRDRILPQLAPIPFDADGFVNLKPGIRMELYYSRECAAGSYARIDYSSYRSTRKQFSIAASLRFTYYSCSY